MMIINYTVIVIILLLLIIIIIIITRIDNSNNNLMKIKCHYDYFSQPKEIVAKQK